ncbi:GFA family protein [Brevundimonas sp.]|uniref:GFA family protein n=1 Tax=Brevundimonas sp. TaxID=1871086 RepID=UPI002737DC5A|nr:GFA family protein [Brevundimonas sp.]MDP3802419.1 GFA family protein [Brevundimonas sp.]
MTVVREAACRCGALRARCEGEPVRVSVCHCLACQRRSGSAFAAQARFPADRVTITGEARVWTRIADSGRATDYSFCPDCGSTVHYAGGAFPALIAIPLGAFADPGFPPPEFSVWEKRRHPWTVVLGDDVEHTD